MMDKRTSVGRNIQSTLLPDVTPDMLSADFWLSDVDTAVEATADSKTAGLSSVRVECQRHIRTHTTSMNELANLLDTNVPVEAIKAQIPPPKSGQTLYDEHGREFPSAFWEALTEKVQRARPINAPARLQPGFAVRRANLRRYPTLGPGFRTAVDREFDRFQDTALHTFEPVLIALQTEDDSWYYIISETYRGWVSVDDIALCTAEEFETWSTIVTRVDNNLTIAGETDDDTADASDYRFVIPLANNVYTQAAPYDAGVSARRLEFAAYIPVCADQQAIGNQSLAGNLTVSLPVRNPEGWLEVRPALVPASSPLSPGFRPYTRASVVQSAFALLGERYGWGDSFGNHDCSSLVMDCYRSVGLQFPRDTGAQEEALPNRVQIPEALTFKERSELLVSFHPGDALYMPGHTMVYLGYRNGHHYAIHDFSGYTQIDGEQTTFVPVNEVMVSTLDICVSSGKTYLEALTAVGSLFEKRDA